MMIWNSYFFQSPNTYLMELVVSLHDYVMMFLFSVLILVLMNLIYGFYMKTFNLNFFENHQLENIWTFVPFILLVFMLIPSLSSLYMLDACMFCGMSISVMGNQWYWSYIYKELSDSLFNSYMTSMEFPNFMRLVEVDNRLLIPSCMPVRLLVSSSDVLHSWALPSFGLKMDAVPGRINQFCFSSKRSGVFFGQCSEICGANHSFMPIVLESVSFKDFIKVF